MLLEEKPSHMDIQDRHSLYLKRFEIHPITCTTYCHVLAEINGIITL